MGTPVVAGAQNIHITHQSGTSKAYLGGESRYPPDTHEDGQDSDISLQADDTEDESQDIDLDPTQQTPNMEPTINISNVHNVRNQQKPQRQTPNDEERIKMNEKYRKEEKERIENEKKLKVLRKQLLAAKIHLTIDELKNLQNNMVYEKVGLGRKYISNAMRAPPEWRKKPLISVCIISGEEAQSTEFETMEEPEHNLIYTPRYGAISDSSNEIEITGRHGLYHIYGQCEYKTDLNEKVVFKEATDEDPTEIIPTKHDKWFISVPVKLKDGNVIYMKMLADAGANIPCINTQYAMNNFKQFICHNNTQSRILTAGSNVLKPKYLVWMTFPTTKGPLLKARFYLVDNLPVDILADINMLRAFGYKFKDEIPPIFRHKPIYSDKLELKDTDELHKIHHANGKDINDMLKIYKTKKMVRMAQQEEYERAVHTHFVQMADCLSTTIKDGKIDVQALLDPYNDHINDCDNMVQPKKEASVDYTHGLVDPRCQTPKEQTEEKEHNQVCHMQQEHEEMQQLRQEVKMNTHMYYSDDEKETISTTINPQPPNSNFVNVPTKQNSQDPKETNNDTNEISQTLISIADTPMSMSDSEFEYVDINMVGITPDATESPQLSAESMSTSTYDSESMIDGLAWDNRREASTVSNEPDTTVEIILINEDSNATNTVNNINSIEDIEIPGVDPISVKQGELLHDIGIDITHQRGPIQCNLASVQTQHQRTVLTNNTAFRNNPTRNITQRIHGTVGNTQVKLLNNIHNVNHAIACHQFQATEEEIKKAMLLELDKALKFNKIDYIKELEKMYPRKYAKLYKGTLNLINEFRHLFAKQLFDRRTLKNVPPARLGVKTEYADDVCFIRQYNIPPLQRLHMIKYTQENDKNGFWYKLRDSENCIPYTMVAKKNKDGKVSRWRPAFDARGVNKWCTLKPTWMPTIRDFDEFFALKGLITIADCKNFFDCIPLHKDDQKWATVLTPLGLRRMQHLTYGWKNAAPIAQNIMNRLCLLVGWMLGFIDDMAIKHPYHYNTKQLLKHLRRFFVACDELGLLLHPSKFWPYATVVESIGLRRTLFGSAITEAYRKKVLSIPRPTTAKEMQSAKGVIGYIGRYIEDYAFYMYWLLQTLKHCTRNGRIVWTPQAEYAWEMIMYNVRHAKILRNPTRNGTFCIKTDASKYGIGAVLYQLQFDVHKQKWKWFIIDMHSAIIKEDLRKSHSMVHEALAIVKACEHWQFHLLKRQFKISCDNRPIVHIFDENQTFDPTTRQQLGRLRTQLRGFAFDIAHVPGIQNELPDGLSRFTAKFDVPEKPTAAPIISNDTGNKKLTEKELEELKKQHKINMIKLISHDINNTAMIIDNMVKPNDNQDKYQTMVKSQKHLYNKICGDFKAHAIHTQRKRVRRFINQNARNLIIGNEYQYNTQPCVNMMNQMQPILSNISSMSEDSLNLIQELTRSEELGDTGVSYSSGDDNDDCKENENENTNETVHIVMDQDDERCNENENIDIEMIGAKLRENENVIIKDYHTLNMIQNELNYENICFTNEKKRKYIAPKATKPHRMQTRSKTKMKRMKKKPKTHRSDYINPESDRLIRRLQTQSDFIHELVGYRTQMDFMHPNTFKTYQESDFTLQTLKYLVSNNIYTPKYIQNEKIKLDLEFIREYHRDLYTAWAKKELRIDEKTKILQKCMKYGADYSPRWLDVVPEVLIGRIMDYGHHNLSLNHLGEKPTVDSILADYWWDSMEKDIKTFIKECRLCQYVKHGKTMKAPMRVRELPRPREHIMADFLDCVLGKYHILVIVDYGSNYAMLVPCEHCDTRAVVDALLSHWIPVFGLFKSFETDFGSGFNNNVMKILMKITGIKHTFAEARNHRGIGKVERLIGYIQTIFNLYNVNSNNQLIPTDHSYTSKQAVWKRVKALLPFVQQSLNRRKPRFTQYSPNMIMFGSELNDYGNIKKMIHELNQPTVRKTIKQEDYEYIHDLLTKLDTIQSSYEADWRKYTHYSAKMYNTKHNIKENENKEKILKQFKTGDQVLYYVGDRQVAGRKWRQRWSGPWHIKSIDCDTIAIEIEDRETTNSKFVSVDRIKPWNNGSDTITLSEFEEYEKDQNNQQQQMQTQYGF